MHKPIMVVGDYWNEQEEREGKPFAGPGAGILYGLLAQAGIDKRECYFTNAINQRPAGNRIESFYGPKAEAIPEYRAIFNGKYIHNRYAGEITRLFEEIERVKPNVIVALGNLALWALAKKSGIKKYRGAPTLTHDQRWKLIPTWAPASILKQWELRIIALADLSKARKESAFPELRRPRRYIYLEPDISDIEEFYEEFLVPSPFVSCDIETAAKTITEVGYSNADGTRAIVIPFYSRLAEDGNYWPSFTAERKAWKLVRMINSTKPTIGQNFSYDMTYFWRTVRIPTPLFLGDTMILHHSLQPELQKGLGFLGSIYTNEPSWKFMRTDHSTLKKEDD